MSMFSGLQVLQDVLESSQLTDVIVRLSSGHTASRRSFE